MNSLVFVRDGGGKLPLGERDLDNILPGVVCQDSPPMNIFLKNIFNYFLSYH